MSNNLQSHIAEGEQIRNAIQTASTRCTELRRQTEQLQRDVETGLRAPAEYAVQGVHMLCCTVENLYDGTHNSVVVRSVDTQKLVRVCKGEAAVVAQRFKTLHDKSTEMTQRAGALSLELSAKLGESETQMKRLNQIQSETAALKRSAEARADSTRGRQRAAEESIVNAQNAESRARNKYDDAKAAVVVRDIFTFGLGRVGDWFGFERDLDRAHDLVHSCRRNLEQVHRDMQNAQNALSAVNLEIQRFNELHSSLDSSKNDIRSSMTSVTSLREKNMQLQNTSLDASLFLGGLVAKAETIQTKCTAAQFARAVLSIEELMHTSAKVKGLIRDQPQKLQSTMEMIARSDEVADEIDSMM